MLALHEVTKSFAGTRVLGPVDLTVKRGSTTVLIGPSGCGKSTLLRLCNGLLWPDAGNVTWDAEPLTPRNCLSWRRRMGYVIQEGGLFPHLTAQQNVVLLARHLGKTRDQCARRLGELADLVRLPLDALERYPAELSGGQRQRVSLMRALFLDPEALLLDEPLGALDPMIRFDLQNDLRAIFNELRKTVLLVTHDLREAGFFADTLIVLRDGSIVQTGSVNDLFERPADDFVRRFVRAQRDDPASPS